MSRLLSLLFFLAFALFAIAEPIPRDTLKPTTVTEELEKRARNCSIVQEKGFICGRRAEPLHPSIISIEVPVSLDKCRNICLDNPKCLSFLYNDPPGQCVPYNAPLSVQGLVYNNEFPGLVYNRHCFVCAKE